MANTLAYYVMKIITALKRFIEQTNGQTTQANKTKPGPSFQFYKYKYASTFCAVQQNLMS